MGVDAHRRAAPEEGAPHEVVADIEDLQFMRGIAERAWTAAAAPKALSSTTRSSEPTRRARPSKEVYAKQSTVPRRDREELNGGLVPGMQTVFMKTQGCAHNVSDGEYMAGLLASYGYEITEEWSDNVDVFLFNSCTVKGPSQDSFLNMVARAKQSGAPVVVAGCVPQGEPGRDDFEGVSIIGTQQIHRVVEVVEEAVSGNTVKLLGQSARPALELPKIRRNALVEIVPISMGCLNRCTYCKTKHARGDLVSYPMQSIVSRVETVVREGVREVWLSSEDTGAYGKDIDVPLPKLLDAIVDAIPDGVMLRIGMTNPPHIIEHMQGVARVLNHPRVFKFLHIPVQCGSNKVLEDMKREYTRNDFEKLADYLLANVPGITIATDVICGFPTETEEDFQETMQLLDKYKFPVVNIAQFYPRPGTVAAKLKKLQGHVVKDRSRRVTSHFHSYSTWDGLVGTEQRVCVVEYGKDANYIVGHTPAYTQVLLPRDHNLLGCQVMARILSAEKWCVKGEVVRVLEHQTPLPQVSFSRPNILPSPSELQARSLTVVSEAPNVPVRPGRAVEEDYGDEEEQDAAPAGAARRAWEDDSEFGAPVLRQRRSQAQLAAAPAPAAAQVASVAASENEGAGAGRDEARVELMRWCVVLLPVTLVLCVVEPVLTSLGAVIAVFLVTQRRGQSVRMVTGGGGRAVVGSIQGVPVVLQQVPGAATRRAPPASCQDDTERRVWQATRTSWVQGEGECCGGADDGCCGGPGGDSGSGGVGYCCGSGAAGGSGDTHDVARKGASSARDSQGTAMSASCCTAGAGACCKEDPPGHRGGMPAAGEEGNGHPEWRKGQLT